MHIGPKLAERIGLKEEKVRHKFALHVLKFVLICLALVAWAPRTAHAIPAYANRLGVACSKCHEPVFPRLNRFGWVFRSLGYRLPGEMNKSLGPLAPAEENGEKNSSHYTIDNTISFSVRGRADHINRSDAKTFDTPYLSSGAVYFSGPVEKNFGYWGEADIYSQSASVQKAVGAQVLSVGTASMTPWVRYYFGTSKSYISGKVGQIGIDGFEANNSSLNTTGSALLTTTKINGTSLGSQTGGSIGYTRANDNVTLYLFNGANGISSTGGVSARPGYTPDIALQYLRFLDKHSSSVQALLYTGKTPTDAIGTDWDKFSRLYLYGNYRRQLGKSDKADAVNLLGGYMNGSNHKLATVQGVTTVGDSFKSNSFFIEADYEHTAKFVPYLRYDTFKNDEASQGTVFSGNPLDKINLTTIGSAVMLNNNVRLNLDYSNNHPTGGPNVSTARAQFWLIF